MERVSWCHGGVPLVLLALLTVQDVSAQSEVSSSQRVVIGVGALLPLTDLPGGAGRIDNSVSIIADVRFRGPWSSLRPYAQGSMSLITISMHGFRAKAGGSLWSGVAGVEASRRGGTRPYARAGVAAQLYVTSSDHECPVYPAGSGGTSNCFAIDDYGRNHVDAALQGALGLAVPFDGTAVTIEVSDFLSRFASGRYRGVQHLLTLTIGIGVA